jgi:uncharacterized protein YhjY with autotransporter beta-barrel domain
LLFSGDLTLTSSGSITPSDSSLRPIVTSANVGTLTNNGSIISNNNAGGGEPIFINNNVTALINNGLIKNNAQAISIFVLKGTLSTLTNSGIIQNLGNSSGGSQTAIGVIGAGWGGSGVITNLNNLFGGVISTVNAPAISAANGGIISNINNAGVISTSGASGNSWGTGDKGAGIYNGALMNSITNTGSISTTTSGAFGIYNSGSITTLNNLQGAGNTNGALTYKGNLPSTYNIILGSNANTYGQLAVTNAGTPGAGGLMSFGIYGGTVSSSKYSAVITGVATSYISSIRTGNYGSHSWSLVESGSGIWDLLFSNFSNIPSGPNTADTQSSIQSLASRLRSGFTSQTIASNFANMNTYDCNLFDAKGICMSVGGQQTYIDNPSANVTSTVVVAGYKVSPHIRIGGFLNQNLNNNTNASVHISNKNPLMGLFGVWNKNENGLGYQVKLANAYQDKDISTTREVIGTSEAGKGSTNLNTQSYVGEVSYAFMLNDKTLVRPYIALRSTTIQQDSYTEDSSVSTPLTYSAIKDRSLTSLVGIKLNHALTSKVSLTGSLGIEQDLEHHVDNLTATGVSGLTSENFNDSIKRTRPVASAGAYFTPVRNQRISGELFYQQLPFQSTGSTTAYVSYAIGF